MAKHGLNPEEQGAYIEKTIDRFRNPYIIDEVTRVGRSPIRKLSPQDRFIKPLRECIERQLPTAYLEKTIANVLKYDFSGDEEALKLQALIKEKGKSDALMLISGFSAYVSRIESISKL